MRLTGMEQRAVTALATIMALRMSGLFLILPVFALYARELEGVTPLQIGIAIGIYGLTQAALQIPFGLLSDHIGRKPVITLGLLIFALGSVIAAESTSIEGIILGRALQGAGAVAAAIMALTADLTREEHRTKAMATIGVTIGLSFIGAMFMGPLLHRWLEVPEMFWFTAGLAMAALLVLHLAVPIPAQRSFHSDAEPVMSQFGQVLRDSQLLRLNFGVFLLHAQLTAVFLVMPGILHDYAGFAPADHGFVYLPILLLAMGMMVPLIIYGEKYHHMKFSLLVGVGLLTLAQLGLAFGFAYWIPLLVLLLLFFLAFNLLEALMPSLISKIAPARAKGTAMGAFSTSQFLGAFGGGIVGGWIHSHYGITPVFLLCGLLALGWFGLIATMRTPPHWTTFLLHVETQDPAAIQTLSERLRAQPGVAAVDIVAEEHTAYLKIHPGQTDLEALERIAEVA